MQPMPEREPSLERVVTSEADKISTPAPRA